MSAKKIKFILKTLAFGLIYPVVIFSYLPLLWLFSELLEQSFSCDLLPKILSYIVFAPCLISIEVTKLLLPGRGIHGFAVIIFFITQAIIYYILGSLLADCLLWKRNKKKASQSSSSL